MKENDYDGADCVTLMKASSVIQPFSLTKLYLFDIDSRKHNSVNNISYCYCRVKLK